MVVCGKTFLKESPSRILGGVVVVVDTTIEGKKGNTKEKEGSK